MERTREKAKSLFPADQFATEIASCIERDLSKAPLFDRGISSDVLFQLRSRQINDSLKRYQSFEGYSRDTLETAAFSSFLTVNSQIRSFNERMRDPGYWDLPIFDKGGNCITLGYVRKCSQLLLSQVLGHFWWDELHTMCKHGSGSTIGVSFEDTSVENKFTYPLSCTESVKPLFEHHTRCNTSLQRAIDIVNKPIAFGNRYDIVKASRGTTVDKTSSKRRMIAVEPTLNMFFQQGLMEMMYARLLDAGLSLESLPARHRDLALTSSINRKYGTIDFAHASDSVSYELVKQFFPPDWFRVLDICRTPEMELAGVSHRLEMFSTMGNATTFPLETLLFWSIACSVHHLVSGGLGSLVSVKAKRVCSVFGDDCIVPTESCDLFIEVATRLGFEVNVEKSFVDPEQSFRESCGGDYYQGIDVRPYSFKAPDNRKMSSLEPWLYTILNNILPRYVMYFGYWQSVMSMELGSYILSLFDQYKLKFKLVPVDFPDDAGLRCSAHTVKWRPRLSLVVDLLETFGCSLATIYRSDSLLDFSYVKFSYLKSRKQVPELRYALQLYCMQNVLIDDTKTTNLRFPLHRTQLVSWLRGMRYLEEHAEDDFSFPRRRSPIRKKGGYVVARTTSRFY